MRAVDWARKEQRVRSGNVDESIFDFRIDTHVLHIG